MYVTGNCRWYRAAALVLLLVASDAFGRTIYVDGRAQGNDDGTSWTNACRYLQDALSASQYGDEIRVAQGTYRPDQASASPSVPAGRTVPGIGSRVNDRTAAFGLRNGVAIKGGYGGWGAPNPDARDVGLYTTVLSGDLAGDDGPDFANDAENSYHVVTARGTDKTAVLEGFTITGGNASDENWDSNRAYGGGVYVDQGSPTLAKCTVVANSAMAGGGMCILGSRPALTDCLFIGNFARNHGGAMDNSHSHPDLLNCAFLANRAMMKYGGAVRNYESSPRLTNCLFSGNSSEGNAGAMFNHSHSNPKLINCTFAGNAAHGVGGIDNALESSPGLTNCILWGNISHSSVGEVAQIQGETLGVEFSCIQGWSGARGGPGNHGHDPQFVDADGPDGVIGTQDDDLRLLPGSPCIDAGTNTGPLPSVTVDLAGNPRIVNGRIDMGAYESAAEPAPKVYHVDALAGNDHRDGLSLQTALATIQKGIEAAEDGDTVLVYPGVYTAEVDFLGKAVTVQGVATKAGVPVLENTRGFAVSFYNGEGPDSVLANLVVRNSYVGIFVAGSSPTIRNITLVDNDSGVEAYVDSEPDIANCIFWRNAEMDLFQCKARYSRLEQPGEGRHNISADPSFVDPDNGDYHLHSARGRYWPEYDVWVLDELTSPCVDGGDPNTPVGQERMPNGGRLNMGAYGGTPYASMSEMPCPCEGESNQPPQVTIVAPVDGAVLNYANRVIVEAEATDADGLVVKVELFVEGNKVGEDVDGSDGWSIEWTDHPAADYTLVARATDDEGRFADSLPIQVSLRHYSRSSKRYKFNVTDLEVDSDSVLKLKPVRFQWKTTKQADVGLIAEEVAERLPDLVICDGEGRPDAVEYEKLSVYLLGIIQMQQDRLAALEASRTAGEALERRVKALESAGEGLPRSSSEMIDAPQ